MTLSLVIPCYNEEVVLEGCLKSICAQKIPPDEVIVVDNNSTDNSMAIVHKYKSKIPNLRILACKEQGLLPTRMLGFDEASGQLVGTIDADSVLNPDWVRIAKDYFASHPQTVAIGGKVYSYMYNLGSVFVNSELLHLIWQYLPSLRMFSGCNGVFRKDIYHKMGGLTPQVQNITKYHLHSACEDFYLSVMFKHYGSLDFVPSLVVKRRNQDSVYRMLMLAKDYAQLYPQLSPS